MTVVLKCVCCPVSNNCIAVRISSGRFARVQCVLEQGADIDHGLVADMQLADDVAVRLALGQERERLQLPQH